MDRLDKYSILVIAILMVISIIVYDGHRGEAVTSQVKVTRPVAVAVLQLDRTDASVSLIRKTIEAGNLDKAEVLVGDLMKQYPYEGMPFLFMGDILMRKQRPLEAMDEYRSAIDLNPDFIDKKSPLFEGKKIKVAVMEASREIEEGLENNPSDAGLRDKRKTLYYLKRRLAGGCG